MAKKLKITFEDNTYILEYTRRSVESLSKQGFKLDDLDDKPVIGWPTLFYGAFLANHRHIKRELTDKIFDNVRDKEGLLKELVDMYSAPVLDLFDEPEENEGNALWERA